MRRKPPSSRAGLAQSNASQAAGDWRIDLNPKVAHSALSN